MPIDLPAIQKQLESTPLVSPFPPELAAAIVSDTFRLAGIGPPSPAAWRGWLKKRGLLPEQLGMLAHVLTASRLREDAVATLQAKPVEPMAALPSFFAKVQPLTAEMIRANTFRQEEFLRRFVEAIGGRVAGESVKVSRDRLEQLDYRTTLGEF